MRLAIFLLIWFALAACAAAEENMRVRIAWGGGPERLWHGTISLSQGTLSELHPLGIEADEPGSIWLEDGRATVRQRTPRSYDGVDVLVTAPREAKLLVQLAAADDRQRPAPVEVPLAELSGEVRNVQLDGHGNRLLVRRTPGDQLRITLAHSSLVFSPGETLKLEIKPHLLPIPPESRVRIKLQLLDGGRELWSKQHDLRPGRPDVVPLEICLPREEGVYDLVVTALHGPNWSHPVRASLTWKKQITDRRVQLLVLNPQRPATPAVKPAELSQVIEINPASPRWWELKVKWPQLPRLTRLKGPLGNGNLKTVRHPLGELSQLAPSNKPGDASWEAYSLAIGQPGRPHVLEVDYPSDVAQTLGISVLEPNTAGALAPIGLDTGIDVGEDWFAAGPPRWARHRVIFWPRTTSPMVLLTNRREGMPAVYGKIRVLAGWNHLPRAAAAEGRDTQRLLAAYLDRPLFPENFSADELLDAWSGRSLDDWRTFHQGGTRLVEYLQHVGYNGLMISVLADGSTIYPSTVLEPTPRYDTGVFFGSGQDPFRKDALEMLFRLFDREELQLVPALDFSAPLPELEAVRRRGGPQAAGIEWVGADGGTWCQTFAPRRGLAPYYNTLDPRVQEAMLAVVREVVGRYARHTAFAGLGLRLSAYGYAQLPGPDWGLDDATIARFEREASMKVPGAGPNRFAARAAFLADPRNRAAWLQWRAAEVNRFYRRIEELLAKARPGAKLYLAGAEMLCGPEIEAELRPALPPRTTLADTLLRAGIDLRHYRDNSRVVLLHPERVVPRNRLSAQAVDLEIGQMTDVDEYFAALPKPGSLFFHAPQELRLSSFDQKSPFRPTYTWLLTEPAPSGVQNRRRFIHSLAATDAQVMFDGGWLLPLGQEDAIRDLVAAYRRLPATRFVTVTDARGYSAAQPVTFRSATWQGRTYLYAVNDAPFPVTARVRLAAGGECRVRELTGARRVPPIQQDGEGSSWSVELEPYDLVAVELSAADVKLSGPQVMLPAGVEQVLGQRIRQLGVQAAALRNPMPLRVLDNPGFERPATTDEPVPGWAISRRPGVAIQADPAQNHSGRQSARISSEGPIACLVSRSFAPPTTGRLCMYLWLRVADARRQPPLRLAVEGKLDGRDYYRFATVGRAADPGQQDVPISTEWAPYIFQVNDLPLEGLSQLHARLDLMGQGEVWVDDVQLYDLALNETELRALYKLITLAGVMLQNGQLGDCVKLLDGYWPRLLAEHVPPAADGVSPGALATTPEAEPSPGAKPPAPPPQTGFMDRMKSLLPERMRF